jgi:spore germination protein YaaH
MRRRLRKGCLILVAITGLSLLAVLYVLQLRVPAYTGPPLPGRVAAWMPTSWDGERARGSWMAHRTYIHELSPVWYQLNGAGDGTILPYPGARDEALVAEAHANGTLVLPLINNAYGGAFDPAPASRVIHDPGRRATHVAALVDEVVAYGYDGIDVDYESLNGEADREAFSLFIEELAAALHAEGRLLAVTVHPKTSEPGTWFGPQSQDWARIGAVADRFRIMTYGYHWSTGEPGPIAPLFWMEEVAAYAVSVVPPERVYLGLHFYGLDWGRGPAAALEWEDAQALLGHHRVPRQWSAVQGLGHPVAEPWFTYPAQGVQRTVWYADGDSVAARLTLVDRYRLGGIAIWRLGGEDPANWDAIAAAFHPVGRAPFPTSTPR